MQKHYIIGDVHGEYQTLLALIKKLPNDAKLIFVGDLVDKGLKSREVIEFIRNNGHQSVKGNHESSVIEIGKLIISYIKGKDCYKDIIDRWTNNRLGTFLSYGLVEQKEDGYLKFINNPKSIDKFLNDSKWMQNLPIYIELKANHISGKRVIVSHSNISKVWELRHDYSRKDFFEYEVQWTRDIETSPHTGIFNIYGHTPQKDSITIAKDYACIDRGCCYHTRIEYGALAAYCVESGEIFEVSHVPD